MLYLVLWLLCALVLLSTILILTYSLYVVWKRRQFSHIPGPPPASFFKGNLDELYALGLIGCSRGQKFLEWHLQYGKVIVVWVWHFPVILVVDPEIVKDILVVKNFPKDPLSYQPLSYLFGQRFMGSGLATNMDHANWKERRSILNPAFHRKSLKELMSAFNATANALLDYLSTMADGKTEISLLDVFARAALDVICKVAFGMDINIFKEKDNKFTNAVALSFHGVEEASFDIFHKVRISQFPYQRSVVNAIRLLRETGRKVIEARKAAMAREEQVPEDILQRIIKQEEVPGTELDDLLDDFISFFIAGHETTASLLAFCVLELGDHPEIEECLVSEVFEVLGDKQSVAFDDLGKLHQLGLALKETLRCHPTATGMLRKTQKEEVMGGYRIPAGITIMLNTHLSGHYPEFWVNPEQFNPYRFDDEEQIKRSHYTYFPFSLGPRNCIGQTFAQIEAKVLLSRFLQTFKFSLVPGQSRGVIERVTLRPKSGVVCTLTTRR